MSLFILNAECRYAKSCSAKCHGTPVNSLMADATMILFHILDIFGSGKVRGYWILNLLAKNALQVEHIKEKLDAEYR